MASSKWLYKIKHAANGSIEKLMTKFVVRRISQKGGIDYADTFAPIARYTSIRVVLSIDLEVGWRIYQMDVKTTLLRRKCI